MKKDLLSCADLTHDDFVKLMELSAKIKLHIPDENSRRVGQSVAAASLPKIK